VRERVLNPVMTFPIKNQINIELFIDRVTSIIVLTNEGDQPAGTS